MEIYCYTAEDALRYLEQYREQMDLPAGDPTLNPVDRMALLERIRVACNRNTVTPVVASIIEQVCEEYLSERAATTEVA